MARIMKIFRLNKKISTGLVFKILLPPVSGEFEHSLHILIYGSIKKHKHPEEEGISEGYREWFPKSDKVSSWKVVGAGFKKKSHKIKYKKGIRFIEGSKRMPGLENWPELK